MDPLPLIPSNYPRDCIKAMSVLNEDKLDALDNEIDAHLRVVAELWTRHNALVPIALLPNEILSLCHA